MFGRSSNQPTTPYEPALTQRPECVTVPASQLTSIYRVSPIDRHPDSSTVAPAKVRNESATEGYPEAQAFCASSACSGPVYGVSLRNTDREDAAT